MKVPKHVLQIVMNYVLHAMIFQMILQIKIVKAVLPDMN